MSRRRTFRFAPLALALLAAPMVARADEAPPSLAISPPGVSAPVRHPFKTREELGLGSRPATGKPETGGGWWLGTAGIALALAACGWASVASRKYLPKGPAGAAAAGLRVVGRTHLSPRHAVYLLKAGDKVLIVGTGPQGAPSLLGEMPGEAAPAVSLRDASPSQRFDVRLGGDS